MNYKKVTSLFLFTTLSIGGVFAQSKEDLKSEIEQLKQQNQMLMQMMQNQQMYQQQGMYPQQGYPQQNMQYPQQGYAQQMPQGQLLPSQFGQAVQRTRVEDAAMTSTGQIFALMAVNSLQSQTLQGTKLRIKLAWNLHGK